MRGVETFKSKLITINSSGFNKLRFTYVSGTVRKAKFTSQSRQYLIEVPLASALLPLRLHSF